MKAAEKESKKSNDKRRQVGAVVVKNDEIIGRGYNCMPANKDNNFPWNRRKESIKDSKYSIEKDHKHLYGVY